MMNPNSPVSPEENAVSHAAPASADMRRAQEFFQDFLPAVQQALFPKTGEIP